MKTKAIISIAIAALVPTIALTQTSTPTAPVPPTQPVPPAPPRGPEKDKRPKEPVTWLGVETSNVPRVVSEQLGLPKGFGVVVDYVVPDGPAAKAGLQQSDIIKMLNDQILTGPDQLGTLIRSFKDGTSVSLTILRKGAEQKIQVTLATRQPRLGDSHEFHFNFDDEGSQEFAAKMEEFGERMSAWGEEYGERMGKWGEEYGEKMGKWGEKFGEKLGERLELLGERAAEMADEETRDQVRAAMDEALRAAEDVRREADRIRVFAPRGGGVGVSRVDMDKAELVFSDEKGELKLNMHDGKKLLTAKDAQGKLLFSGPVESKEELDKLPAEVRERYNKLKETHIPAVAPLPPVPPLPSTPLMGDEEDEEEDDDDRGDVTMISCPKSSLKLAPVSWGRRNLRV